MSTITPNMNLTLPGVLTDYGPAWAGMLNGSLSQIDIHDHTFGKGVQIPSTGININADLEFNSNNINTVRSLRLDNQTGTLGGGDDVRGLYAVNGDLYYNNSNITPVQITSGDFLASNLNLNLNEQIITGNITISPTDAFYLLLVDTSGNRSITLPFANSVPAGRYYIMKDKTGNAVTHPFTINPAGGDTINTAASPITCKRNYGGWQLVSNGSNNWDLLQFSDPNLSSYPYPLISTTISKNVTLAAYPSAAGGSAQIPSDWSWFPGGWLNHTQNTQLLFEIDRPVDLATINSIDFIVHGGSFLSLPTGSGRAAYSFFPYDGYAGLIGSGASVFDPSANVSAFNNYHVVHLDLSAIVANCFVNQTPANPNDIAADYRKFYVGVTSPNNNYQANAMTVTGIKVNYTVTKITPG